MDGHARVATLRRTGEDIGAAWRHQRRRPPTKRAVGKGFSLTFTPEGSFSGAATVTYTLSNQYGPSAPATVTIAVDTRPDPAADPEVNALADGQADLTRRFATAQIANFAQRNEALHGDAACGMAIGLAPGVADRMLSDRYAPQRGGRAAVDRNDPVERLFNRLTPEQEFNALAQGAEGAWAARKANPREAGGVEGWAAGSITVGRREANGGAAKFDLASSGLSAGVDLKLSPGFSVGIGGGAAATWPRSARRTPASRAAAPRWRSTARPSRWRACSSTRWPGPANSTTACAGS
jgi:hypothetical protein